MSSSRSPTDPAPSREVTIVSANAETLDGLEGYLRRAGLTARCSRRLAGCSRLATARTRAVVLFPDDFDTAKVRALLAAFASRDPRIVPILVTAHPQRYRAVDPVDAVETIIVPRPAWAWTVLDAIRACEKNP